MTTAVVVFGLIAGSFFSMLLLGTSFDDAFAQAFFMAVGAIAGRYLK